MRSSTSSSEPSVPAGQWGRTWALAAVLAVLGIGAQEMAWRKLGYQPTIQDDVATWAMARSSVYRGGQESIVVIGSSRILLGCDLDAFAEVFGGPKPVQLALDGKSPLLILEDLGSDDTFRGLVLCSLTPKIFFSDDPAAHGVPAERVEAYRSMTPVAGIELRLRHRARERLTLLRAECSTRSLLRGLLIGKWSDVRYIRMRPDRWMMADYAALDMQKEMAAREERTRQSFLTARPVDMPELRRRVRAAVSAIQGRGGQVVFVRLPSSGKVLELEQEKFPRAGYWDAFAAGVPAPTIHFQDYPELAGFECPEGSHLDYRDATPFTKALARILKGVLDRARPEESGG